VENMGGRIEVKSRRQKSTTFMVTFGVEEQQDCI